MNMILQQAHYQYRDDSFVEPEEEVVILEEHVVQDLAKEAPTCFMDIFSSLQHINIVHPQDKNEHNERDRENNVLQPNTTLSTRSTLLMDNLSGLAYSRVLKQNQQTVTPSYGVYTLVPSSGVRSKIGQQKSEKQQRGLLDEISTVEVFTCEQPLSEKAFTHSQVRSEKIQVSETLNSFFTHGMLSQSTVDSANSKENVFFSDKGVMASVMDSEDVITLPTDFMDKIDVAGLPKEMTGQSRLIALTKDFIDKTENITLPSYFMEKTEAVASPMDLPHQITVVRSPLEVINKVNIRHAVNSSGVENDNPLITLVVSSKQNNTSKVFFETNESTPSNVIEKAEYRDSTPSHLFFSGELTQSEVQKEKMDSTTSRTAEYSKIDVSVRTGSEKIDSRLLTVSREIVDLAFWPHETMGSRKTVPVGNDKPSFSQHVMPSIERSVSSAHTHGSLSLKLSGSEQVQCESMPTSMDESFIKESRHQLERVVSNSTPLLKSATLENAIPEKQASLLEGYFTGRIEHVGHSVKQMDFIQQQMPVTMVVDLQQQLTEPLMQFNKTIKQQPQANGMTSEAVVLSSVKNEGMLNQPTVIQEKMVNIDKTGIFTHRVHLQNLSSTLHELQQQQVNINVEHKTEYAMLRLDPPSLGKIEIKMVLQEGRLNITLFSPHSDVQHAIKSSTNYLLQQLEDPSIHDISIAVSGQRIFSDKGSGEEHASTSSQQAVFKKDDEGEEQHHQKELHSTDKNTDDSILVRV